MSAYEQDVADAYALCLDVFAEHVSKHRTVNARDRLYHGLEAAVETALAVVLAENHELRAEVAELKEQAERWQQRVNELRKAVVRSQGKAAQTVINIPQLSTDRTWSWTQSL